MQTLTGIATSRGLASGPVFVYRDEGRLTVPEYKIPAQDAESEIVRVRKAREAVRKGLEDLITALKSRAPEEDVRIFEGHLMILDDPLLEEGVSGCIRKECLNAEAAVQRAAAKVRAMFVRMSDPYLRERVRDLDDLERRVLEALLGFAPGLHQELKTPSVIVADDLTPSEVVSLPRSLLLGFAMAGGSATSHVALLSRAMGVPAVTGLGDILSKVGAGDHILLDGAAGLVTLAPDAETRAAFEARLTSEKRETAKTPSVHGPIGQLRDGTHVALLANAYENMTLEDLRKVGAQGIGLYRSEYLWLGRKGEPTEDEQCAAYAQMAAFAQQLSKTASATIRVLDIGGDKIIQGLSRKEANPFLGNRSIRYLLSHPDTFRTQLRAVLRASVHGHIHMMYPMVSCVEELQRAAQTLAEVRDQLDKEGVPYNRTLSIGAMIEVPAAALNARALAPYVSFFSIGTNDLVQYAMAADRGNEAVSNLYQPLNPAIMRLVEMTVEAAREAGIPVSVCGESASEPVSGLLWIALGVQALSMSPAYIPRMASLLAAISREDLAAYRSFVSGLPRELPAGMAYERCRVWLQRRFPSHKEAFK